MLRLYIFAPKEQSHISPGQRPGYESATNVIHLWTLRTARVKSRLPTPVIPSTAGL